MLRYRIENISDDKPMDAKFKYLQDPEVMHWHEFYEVELILSGAGVYHIDGVDYPIVPNTMYLMNPCSFSEVHFSEPTTLINIIFTSEACDIDLLTEIFSKNSHLLLQIDAADIPFFSILASEMEKHITQTKKIDPYMVNLLNCYLGKIRNQYIKPSESRSYQSMQYVILYIQNHFVEPITLEDAARITNYSSNYFSNQFKAYTGMTFKQYLLDLRFNFAKKLLVHTDLSMQQVADKCGFRDYSFFLSSFKKRFGATPKQYREQRG